MQSFELNLNLNQLRLTFNERIKGAELNLTRFRLQEASSSPNFATIPYGTLTDMSGQPVTNDIEIIYVNLLQEPALSLKTNSDFGTLPNNTFLQFENASFEDLIGIPNVENISQASDVTPDETKASIESFTLDLNTAQLLLTFDDVVDNSTGIFTGITIQESQQGNLRVPLTGGTVISPSGYVIIILLESDDVILLKSISGLATSRANTYLVINEDTFKDAAARSEYNRYPK